MHLVFDLDGVLLDSESDLSWLDRGLDAALRAVGLPATREHRRKLYPGDRETFERTARELGLEPEALWAVRDDHYTREKVAAIESGELAPFPDVECLHTLREDHELHVISNSPRPIVEAFVTMYGFDDLFRERIGRGRDLAALEEMKPDTAFFERLSRRTTGDRYCYVGDTDTDRAFAANAGIPFLKLDRDGGGDLTTLAELTDYPL